jgi:hypothetical protein
MTISLKYFVCRKKRHEAIKKERKRREKMDKYPK